MRLSLRQIRAFVSVAETQSFTRAAEQLNLTQSAVSMLVRQMEDVLEIRLFDRTGQGAILTEFGAHALPGFERALAELQDITDAAQGLTNLNQGYLRLALTQVLSIAWLPQVLASYREAYPGIQIEIVDTVGDRILEAVSNNEAEIGIGPNRTLPPELEAHPIWEIPIQIALPMTSPLARKTHLEGEDLSQCRWIHYSDEFSLFVERTMMTRRKPDRLRGIRVRGLMPALAHVSEGNYATAAPAYAVVFEPLFGIALREIVPAAEPQTFNLYCRRGAAISPAAQSFCAFAKAQPPIGATESKAMPSRFLL